MVASAAEEGALAASHDAIASARGGDADQRRRAGVADLGAAHGSYSSVSRSMCLFYVGFKRLCWWWWLGCLLPGWKRKSSGGRAGRPGGCRLMDLGGSSDEEDGAKVQKKPSKYSLLYFLEIS